MFFAEKVIPYNFTWWYAGLTLFIIIVIHIVILTLFIISTVLTIKDKYKKPIKSKFLKDVYENPNKLILFLPFNGILLGFLGCLHIIVWSILLIKAPSEQPSYIGFWNTREITFNDPRLSNIEDLKKCKRWYKNYCLNSDDPIITGRYKLPDNYNGTPTTIPTNYFELYYMFNSNNYLKPNTGGTQYALQRSNHNDELFSMPTNYERKTRNNKEKTQR